MAGSAEKKRLKGNADILRSFGVIIAVAIVRGPVVIQFQLRVLASPNQLAADRFVGHLASPPAAGSSHRLASGVVGCLRRDLELRGCPRAPVDVGDRVEPTGPHPFTGWLRLGLSATSSLCSSLLDT